MATPAGTLLGTAAEGRLDNNANNSSPPGQSTARNDRYEGRAALWKVSSLPRCRKCGRVSRSATGEVGVRSSNGVAGFAGLVTCGSVWVCPVCSQKIMARRAIETGAGVASAAALSLPTALVTLTMRHHKGQGLGMLWDALAKGWTSATSGKYWTRQRDAAGLWGYQRVVESTYGKNGWHVHPHVLMYGEGIGTESGLEELVLPMWERWARSLKRSGLEAPLLKGSDWQIVGNDLDGTKLGKYLAKGAGASGAIALELTQTQSKIARGRYSTESHWTLLKDGPVNGEIHALRLWREWERASKGRRQMTWSRDLRKLLGINIEERTDEEIASEELGNESDTVVWITRPGWAWMVSHPALIPQLLTAAESMNQDQLSAWLWTNGIDHRKAQTDAVKA
jgi:hypothetical protein